MKKYTTLLFLVAAIGASAQTKIKSIASGDSIWLNKGSFEIRPVIATALGDTARSMLWIANRMSRDTTVGFSMNVQLFNKSGASIATFDLPMPPLSNVAGYVNNLDTYILYLNPRFQKP